MENQLTRGVSYGININQENAFTENALSKTNSMISETGLFLHRELNEINKKVDMLHRKPRKKLVMQQPLFAQDGSFSIGNFYDDGSTTLHPMFLKTLSTCEFYNLEIIERNACSIFALHFPRENYWIFGKKKQLSANYLFDLFIRNGIIFNPEITVSKQKMYLYQIVAPCIEESKNTLRISSLAGWHNGIYQCKKNFQFLKVANLLDFPVSEKDLAPASLSINEVTKYFDMIQAIKDPRTRLLIFSLPYYAALSSLMSKFVNMQKFVINLVVDDSLQTRKLVSLFKILLTKSSFTTSAEITPSKLEQALAISKDEIFLLDARSTVGSSSYTKLKTEQNVRKAIAIQLGQHDCAYSNLSVPDYQLLILSSTIRLGEKIVNIFSNEIISEDSHVLYNEEVLPTIMATYIDYLTQNFSRVEKFLKKQEKNTSPWYVSLSISFAIAKDFWKANGIDLDEKLEYSKSFSWNTLEMWGQIETENLISQFVDAVYANISTFIIKEKNIATKESCDVIFDEDYIWFKPGVIDGILKSSGLRSHLFPLLNLLKEEGFLHLDSSGYRRTLMLKSERFETYQIRRNLFDKVGRIDITALGKE